MHVPGTLNYTVSSTLVYLTQHIQAHHITKKKKKKQAKELHKISMIHSELTTLELNWKGQHFNIQDIDSKLLLLGNIHYVSSATGGSFSQEDCFYCVCTFTDLTEALAAHRPYSTRKWSSATNSSLMLRNDVDSSHAASTWIHVSCNEWQCVIPITHLCRVH